MKYSVLMSVYYKENPRFLEESIESMLNQTVPADEIIVVKDGILTIELDQVLKRFESQGHIIIVNLNENQGLGIALAEGFKYCKNEYVARMDSDDVAHENRCELQLNYLLDNPNIDVVGTFVGEFIDTPQKIVSYKKVPLGDKDIKRYMKKRNPLNHPSVMFKKSQVIKSGGYQHFLLNEDYYLWIRMAHNGCQFANIEKSLLFMRTNSETYLRRGGWNYYKVQKKLFRYMLEIEMINYFQYLGNNIIRFVFRVLISNKLRKWLYLKVLRRKVER